jgi:hypothetical protein
MIFTAMARHLPHFFPSYQVSLRISSEIYLSNPDLQNEDPLPTCHCEHLKGACLHAEVSSIEIRLCRIGVSARRRGNLFEKGEIASFHSQ